eukprot:scaffold20483_cov52-Phaeocystis_antarctica.AAC.3
MGGFGGGWLEYGSSTYGSGRAPSGPASRLGVSGRPEPPGAAHGVAGAGLGRCQGRHFDPAARPAPLSPQPASDAQASAAGRSARLSWRPPAC